MLKKVKSASFKAAFAFSDAYKGGRYIGGSRYNRVMTCRAA